MKIASRDVDITSKLVIVKIPNGDFTNDIFLLEVHDETLGEIIGAPIASYRLYE